MSTAGSRLRRNNARRFFSKVNERLRQWQRDGLLAECGQLHYASPPRIWAEIFACRNPPCPLEKRDPRWRQLALGVGPASFAEFERVARAMGEGTIAWDTRVAEDPTGLLDARQ